MGQASTKSHFSRCMALASCGDIIYVDKGTYTEENLNIPDNTDDVSIIGAGNDKTIFDGDNTDDWLTFAAGGNTVVRLRI